jgi:hypothetical protein
MDAYLKMQHWQDKDNQPQSTLVITVQALEEIFANETSVLAPEDVAGFLECIARYAEKHHVSDPKAVRAWINFAQEVAGTDEDEP